MAVVAAQRVCRVQVVCEESPAPYRYGSRSSQKQRYVAGIVSPAQPVYLHGLVDDAGDAAQRLDTSPPVLGIAASVGGYQVRCLMPMPRRRKSAWDCFRSHAVRNCQEGRL